ncbi:glycosyltransferase family 4 protein [Actinomadura monticuli]|uniref:Glycosyltransferase family 4 protein n=1 Tax=Actinomadura monticuli TaxID=3097367 RepID=A0ABV4QKC3_9ACTN
MIGRTTSPRVAFVLVSYAPDTPAGMERATGALAMGLHAMGCRTIIITASANLAPSPDTIRLQSLRVEFPMDDAALRKAIVRESHTIRSELGRILTREAIDIVVYVDALWGLGCIMPDHHARRVLAVHVLGHREDMDPAIGRADRVIAPSPALIGDAAARGYRADSWRVVPNALLHERIPADVGERERLRREGPFRTLARPALNKGVLDLLKSVPAGLDRPAHMMLAAAPFDTDHETQQSIVDRCVRACVPPTQLSVRRLSWAQAPAWLAKAAVVLVPSHAESFGLVALEAMNAGTPVVAYDVGNLPDLIGTGDDAGGTLVEREAGPRALWRAALALVQDRVTYLHTSRAAYYRSRDFRPTSIAEHFLKAVW